MDVKVGSRWESVVTEAVESGRYASAEDVVTEGLRLFAAFEQRRRELKESIEAAFDEGGSYTVEEVIAYSEEVLATRSASKAAE